MLSVYNKSMNKQWHGFLIACYASPACPISQDLSNSDVLARQILRPVCLMIFVIVQHCLLIHSSLGSQKCTSLAGMRHQSERLRLSSYETCERCFCCYVPFHRAHPQVSVYPSRVQFPRAHTLEYVYYTHKLPGYTSSPSPSMIWLRLLCLVLMTRLLELE